MHLITFINALNGSYQGNVRAFIQQNHRKFRGAVPRFFDFKDHCLTPAILMQRFQEVSFFNSFIFYKDGVGLLRLYIF